MTINGDDAVKALATLVALGVTKTRGTTGKTHTLKIGGTASPLTLAQAMRVIGKLMGSEVVE